MPIPHAPAPGPPWATSPGLPASPAPHSHDARPPARVRGPVVILHQALGQRVADVVPAADAVLHVGSVRAWGRGALRATQAGHREVSPPQPLTQPLFACGRSGSRGFWALGVPDLGPLRSHERPNVITPGESGQGRGMQNRTHPRCPSFQAEPRASGQGPCSSGRGPRGRQHHPGAVGCCSTSSAEPGGQCGPQGMQEPLSAQPR